MLKASAGDHIFLGLSDRNLELLREGRPIKVDLSEFGVERVVMIFWGRTEQAMRDDLLDMVGPDTKYRDDLPKDS